jgi:hypothetical protein
MAYAALRSKHPRARAWQQLKPRRGSRILVDVENSGHLGMLQLDALCMDGVPPKQDSLSL